MTLRARWHPVSFFVFAFSRQQRNPTVEPFWQHRFSFPQSFRTLRKLTYTHTHTKPPLKK